jgi:hypothetical protein
MGLVALAALLPAPAAGAEELLPPVRVQADGRPIDVEHGGHAAPCVGDFDGDGVDDLMIGEVYEGRMRIFRNAGSNEQFKLSGYTWFKCGADLGRVPSG